MLQQQQQPWRANSCKLILIANLAVYALNALMRKRDARFTLKHFALSLENLDRKRFYTLITHCFSHVDFPHLSKKYCIFLG